MTDESEDNPLLKIDTHTGKLYWLNLPRDYGIHFENLKSELDNRTFHEDISEEFDLDSENIEVPDVFSKDGKMVRTTTTENVNLINSTQGEVIFGEISLDTVDKVVYRNKEIIVMDTTTSKFIIFEQDGHYYLSIVARRGLSETIKKIFKKEFSAFGSMINQTRLSHDAITHIRTRLDADLVDTIITDYDQKEISQTRIQGESYQDTDVYQSQQSSGKVKTHMFQTEKLVPDEAKTVMIGRDGMVRIYSNATIETYLDLLGKYVIPEIHRDLESSPSVGSYKEISSPDSHPIFRKVKP